MKVGVRCNFACGSLDETGNVGGRREKLTRTRRATDESRSLSHSLLFRFLSLSLPLVLYHSFPELISLFRIARRNLRDTFYSQLEIYSTLQHAR